MTLDSENIRRIYKGEVGQRYDFSMPPFFMRWKRLAFQASGLCPGDRVLVFCCGTGLDFGPVIERVGEEGSILGVDFSPVMLEQAKRRVESNGWENVELIEADVTAFEALDKGPFDAAVCTLGLSLVPEFEKAYENLLAHIKPGGSVVIGDMRLASGFKAKFDPMTLWMAKKFGGTAEGHRNTVKLLDRMKEELDEVRIEDFFLGSYFFCVGKKPGPSPENAE